MTDSELIKALDNKVHGSDYACFEDYEILALIKRQQTEINKLERARQKQAYLLCNLRAQKYELMNRMSIVKNEAYEEFANKIYQAFAVENTREGYLDCTPNYTRLMECVDDVLKELVGDDK